MDYPLDLAGWMDAVLETIRANKMKACYIRPLLYRGYGALGVNPEGNPLDAAIMVWEWGAYLGHEALEQGVDVKVSSWTRMAPNTLPAMAKSTANYANSALVKMEAIADGYSEGIVLDVAGHVSEGSGQNIFIVRDNMIYTPSLGSSILGGITRDSIITLARGLGYTVTESVDPARGAVPRRRGVLRRHGRRGDAGPVGRQDPDRRRTQRARSPKPCSARSSTSSTARCPTRTAG